MSQTCSTHGRENSAQPHLVFTNDDLLTEILIRLPILYPRLESRKSAIDNSFTLGFNAEADHVKILQSYNGLLLCSSSGSPAFYYVYNPSTNKFKRLSFPENSHDDSHLHATGVLGMAFDPTKSRYYKVGRNFLQSFGGREGSYDPMLEQIDIPGILHLQGRLFELHGCLLLACRDDIDSREFTIYEMVKGCFVLTVRYLINTDEFMTPLRERWSIQSIVWSIGLGERE
ncbi:hypothetical protein Tco_1010673 [Tanacetum coccineum]